MDLATARKVLSWAEAGLPVIVVGAIPDRARGYRPGDDTALREVLEDLSQQPSVQYVAKESGVLGALKAAGVTPAATYAAPSPFLNIRRTSADTDYWYFWNSDDEQRATTEVLLRGQGDPYRYNPWTGTVERISTFTRTAAGVRVRISADAGDGVLLALTTGNSDTAALPSSALHVVSTTADRATVDRIGKVTVTASAAGTYVTKLSNGRTVRSTVPAVPAVASPVSWTLDVTSYTAGATIAETVKTPLATTTVTPGGDGHLPSWTAIDGLAHVSGEGVYTTSLDVPAAIASAGGVRMDLGTVHGTVRVSVNGTELPSIDQLDVQSVDLGRLRAGANTIEVHVATLLGNARFGTTADYGLLGPVAVTAHRSVTVDSRLGTVRNVARPTVTGKPRVGSILRATSGRWTPVPTSYRYSWYAGGKRISGATSARLALGPAQLGKRIRVVVTARRAGFTDASASSSRTTVVRPRRDR